MNEIQIGLPHLLVLLVIGILVVAAIALSLRG